MIVLCLMVVVRLNSVKVVVDRLKLSMVVIVVLLWLLF